MPTAHSKSQLPLDISVETIISVILICIGLVSEAEELQPISWRIWAGNLEREGGGAGPFQGLEDRIGFIDIRVYLFSAFTPRSDLMVYSGLNGFLGTWVE